MKQWKTKIITQYGKEVEAVAPMILSVSRATDVPAFYSEWLFKSLEHGYCRWRNPFNGVDAYVSLNDVRFVVFWSKNSKPLILTDRISSNDLSDKVGKIGNYRIRSSG